MPPAANPTPDLDAAWFAATLDSGAFDAGQTLRPPDERPFDPVTAPTLGVDHDAATVPPAAPRRQDLSDLPRLTWSEVGVGSEQPAEIPNSAADLTVVRLLGEGGMGRVHLAHQRSLQRDVALKTVKPEADRPATRAGLWREALVMARLDHPNVVPVHVLGVDKAGRPALVMKRIDGVSWQHLLDHPDHPQLQRLGGRDALDCHLEILARVADAVEFAHAHGVLHRDIKPDNVLVGSFGEVYLGDWGVALELPAVEGPLAVVGTPAWLAPEMLDADASRLGPTTDVFLLVATLHLLLTGKPRHAGRTLREVLQAARHPSPVVYAPDVPRALADLANRACAADPAQRPASAALFRQSLRDWQRNQGLEVIAIAAQAQLAELDVVLARGPGNDREGFIRTVHRLATEARFGFVQVCRADPDHAGAQRGLRDCLERLIAFEVAAGHTAAARALYKELGREVAQLDQAIAQLEQRDAVEVQARERLAALERDLDPNAGWGVRVVALLVVAAMSMAILWYATRPGAHNTIGQFSLFGVVTTLALGVLAWVLRHHVKTRDNRLLLFGAPLVAALIALHRGILWWTGQQDVARALATDAAVLGAFGIAQPQMGWPAWIGGAHAMLTAYAILVWPEHALWLFVSVTVVYPVLFVARGLPGWWRRN